MKTLFKIILTILLTPTICFAQMEPSDPYRNQTAVDHELRLMRLERSITDLTTEVTGVLPLANGGTGAALVDPGSDSLVGWVETNNANTFISLGSNFEFSGNSLGFIESDYTSGSYKIFGPSEIKTISASSWTKFSEVYIPRGGTISVKFGAACYTGPNDGSARIYVNGSATGTTRSANSGWQEWTEDINISAGDLLQVYGVQASGSVCSIGAVRVYISAPIDYPASTETLFNMFYVSDTDVDTRLTALGSIGDIAVEKNDGVYIKTGASTWTKQ